LVDIGVIQSLHRKEKVKGLSSTMAR
jgi:hypothetical protein